MHCHQCSSNSVDSIGLEIKPRLMECKLPSLVRVRSLHQRLRRMIQCFRQYCLMWQRCCCCCCYTHFPKLLLLAAAAEASAEGGAAYNCSSCAAGSPAGVEPVRSRHSLQSAPLIKGHGVNQTWADPVPRTHPVCTATQCLTACELHALQGLTARLTGGALLRKNAATVKVYW
jgi:hypothetical protein